MTKEKALKEITKRIGTGKGCLFADKTQLAYALDMHPNNVQRFFRGDRPIPDSCLELFGLERVIHEDTYRKVSK